MTRLTLNLLGRFEAYDNRSIKPLTFPRKKAAALLAYLASPTGHERSREDIADLFWGHTGEPGARNNLRQTLHTIHRMLPDFRGFETTPHSLILLQEHVTIDVTEFELAAKEGTLSALERAADLYVGHFLQGFSLREDLFERWRARETARLRDIGLSVFEQLMAEYVATNRQADAVITASRTIGIDPIHEGAHQTLIRAYAAQGRIGLARQQYDTCRDLLAGELGTSPSRETERIYSTLLGSKIADRTPQDRALGAPIILPIFHTAPIVAVLPFEYSGAELSILAETLAPKLIAVLAAALPLTIVDNRSVSLAAAQQTSTTDLAISFGARYAVEGSIRSWSNRWRTEFSLVDVLTGRHLCTGSCDNADADLFMRTDTLALQIGAKITNQIETSERNNVAGSHTGSADAWQSFNRGLALLDRGWHTDIQPARLAFSRAVEIEPFNARAISGLAYGVLKGAMYRVVENCDDAFAEAHELAFKAYALDHSDPYVNLILGQTSMWTERFGLAGESLQRALDVLPDHPEFCRWMGNFLSKTGFLEKGMPFVAQGPTHSSARAIIVARCYLQLGSYNMALDWSKRALQISPRNAWGRFVKASALGYLDRPEEAFAALQECEDLHPGRVKSEFLASPNQYKDPREHDKVLAGVLKAGWQP